MSLEQISGFSDTALFMILPFIVVLAVVIFIHELGHFLVARWCGVRVLTFSIGFGPEIVGFNDRRGTRWRIAAIPLGGYVRFLGDGNAASGTDFDAVADMDGATRAETFAAASLPARAAIVAAGPIANFILAIVVFTGLFLAVGRPVTDALIDTVDSGSAAERAGFQPGDVVIAVDGDEIHNFFELQRIVSSSAGQTLTVTVKRDDKDVPLTATPDRREIDDGMGNRVTIGALGIRASGEVERVRAGPVEALVLGVEECAFIITQTIDYIGGLITGRESVEQLSGPIGIARVTGKAAEMGIDWVIRIIAILSVSIGLLNLFPIPMLDGGHLLYYAIEALRGRPLSERMQEYGMRLGLVLVLALMVVATRNDILKILAS
jgi:regulator of sigma E protease